MKKNLTGIFLLFCLIAPFTVSYLWLQHEKKMVKKAVKRQLIAGLNKEDLILLKFTKKETVSKLSWKHSKEFEFNGQMYDIVSTEVKGDSIIYNCWWDNDETALNKKLDTLVDLAFGNHKEKNDHQKRIISFFKSLYCAETFAVNYQLIPLDVTHNSDFNFNLTGISLSPPVPPPKAA